MSPSQNQTGANTDEYRNIYHRVFTTEIDPQPIINGISNYGEAKTARTEARKCNVTGEVSKDIALKLKRYSE